MPPPEMNARGSESEGDAIAQPDIEATTSSQSPGPPGLPAGHPKLDRVRERKLQRQRRMKQAWRKLVDSFDEVFSNSDEDEESDPEPYYQRKVSSPGHSNDGSQYARSKGGLFDGYRPPPRVLRSANDHRDRINVGTRSSARPRSVESNGAASVYSTHDPARPGPLISFITELYEYSVGRHGDYGEAVMKDTIEKHAPMDVVQAKMTDQSATEGLVFKLVKMYALPRVRRHEESTEEDRKGDKSRHTGSAIAVSAELGTYMIITSQAVLKALRTIISTHPDLPRLAESVTLPEPFCFIVQYKKEIEEYLTTLAALPKLELVDVQPSFRQSLPGQTQTAVIESAIAGFANIDLEEAASALPSDSPGRVELTGEQQERHDLQILMKYVFSADFNRKYEAELALHVRKKCTFELAWLLFRPGSYVYSWEGASLNCFIVDSVELEGLFAKRTKSGRNKIRPQHRPRGGNFSFSRTPKSIMVRMCYLEFDGEFIGRRLTDIVISAFDGEKNIVTLPVFPQEYCTLDGIREKLITRGKRYVELTKRTYAEYDGETLSVPRRSVKSRIMIDSQTFYNNSDHDSPIVPRLIVPKEEGDISSDSNSSFGIGIYRDRHSNTMDRRGHRNTRLTEHDLLRPNSSKFKTEQYMLLTQKIYGFVLKERIWDLLDISCIKEPDFQEDMISDLVIKEEARTLIQALSNSHSMAARTEPDSQQRGLADVGRAPTTWSADFVQSKGEGRIFLLHGQPGVGKTTTAECIAEQSRSPLLNITCGDLGITPSEVERNLMKWLKLATLWRAVLLLDEADVYLESRVSGDLQRNSLVCIFLRALEYYQGLLFLTTNRIGTFDEALISRIHVVLHYPNFTDEQRQTIWQTSFRKLDEERPDIKLGPGVMDYALDHGDLKKLKWNGREIRNAFNTMVALAEFDAEKKRRLKPGEEKSVVVKLERSHLKQVVEMSANFKDYMIRAKGMNESKFQHVSRIRDGDIIQNHEETRRQ